MESQIINLYTFLEKENIAPSVVAAAVKKYGVSGWDNYGTYGKFKKDSDAATLALSEIEKYHRVDLESRIMGLRLTRCLPYFTGINPILQLGWFPYEKPDFDALKKAIGTQPEYEFPKSRPETELAIIGGLLHALLGKTSSRPHPDFKSQQQVIDFLIDEYKDLKLSGISKTSLEDKFSAANAYLSKKKN
jgi:hypothetical protein